MSDEKFTDVHIETFTDERGDFCLKETYIYPNGRRVINFFVADMEERFDGGYRHVWRRYKVETVEGGKDGSEA